MHEAFCGDLYIRASFAGEDLGTLEHLFATIFFISYAKLLFLMSIPLNHTRLTDDYGHVLKFKFTYVDPTIPYGRGKHIYVLASSAIIFIVIILPPILILMAYPTRFFRRLQERLSSRISIAINTFVSTFQGCYKDGLNGTRDYCAMSGGILALGVLMIVCANNPLVEVGDRQPILAWQTAIIFLVLLTVAAALLKPYKSDTANHTALCLMAMLIITATVYQFEFVHIVSHNNSVILIVLVVPHCAFYGYVLYKIRSEITGVCRRYCRSEAREYEELHAAHQQ